MSRFAQNGWWSEGDKPRMKTLTSEILAWRGWEFVRTYPWAPVLRSVNHDTRWEGPRLVAHEVPTLHNRSGIYALRDFPALDDGEYWDYFTQAAYGEVALSGTVVEGEFGYRAEQAMIRRLWVANPQHFGEVGQRHGAWSIAAMLAQRYDVDVDVACGPWTRSTYFRGVDLLSCAVSAVSCATSAVSLSVDAHSAAFAISGLYNRGPYSARLAVIAPDLDHPYPDAADIDDCHISLSRALGVTDDAHLLGGITLASDGRRYRAHKRLDGTIYLEGIDP